MYQATTPSGPLEAAQTAAFKTMKTVLIRVTGRRNADEDPALSPLVSNARRYVQQYQAAPEPSCGSLSMARPSSVADTEQSTLVGSRAAHHAGAAGGSNRGTGGSVITTDDTPISRRRLMARPSRGLPLMAERRRVQKFHIDFATVNGGSPSTFTDIARMGSDGVLIRARECVRRRTPMCVGRISFRIAATNSPAPWKV